MRYTFTGKNITVTQAIKDKVMQKFSRLEKLLPNDPEVFFTLQVIKTNHIVEVTIPLNKRILRAEVTNSDTYTAIDEIVDILEQQIVRYKGRLRSRSRKEHAFKEELSTIFNHNDDTVISDESSSIRIEKTKRFALKPMDAEEAVMEMELSGHNFFVFRNGQTDEVNVVYKRKDASYGLIEPEF